MNKISNRLPLIGVRPRGVATLMGSEACEFEHGGHGQLPLFKTRTTFVTTSADINLARQSYWPHALRGDLLKGASLPECEVHSLAPLIRSRRNEYGLTADLIAKVHARLGVKSIALEGLDAISEKEASFALRKLLSAADRMKFPAGAIDRISITKCLPSDKPTNYNLTEQFGARRGVLFLRLPIESHEIRRTLESAEDLLTTDLRLMPKMILDRSRFLSLT